MPVSGFVHLHNHSDYSLLKGASRVPAMVDRAHELGMTHLALTDSGNMFGALRFYQECRKKNITPIIGTEVYLAQESRLTKSGTESGNRYSRMVLLAKDYDGYRNLMEISSAGYLEGFYYKPRVDDEILATYSRGLIALSGSIAGEIPQLIVRNRLEDARRKALFYRDLFGEDSFYLELTDHGVPEERIVRKAIIELSRETGIPLVAANDCHYVQKEDANAQDVLVCIGTNRKKNDQSRTRFITSEYYIKSGDEMERLFSDVPEAIENSARIAGMCTLEMSLPGPMLPDYQIPEAYENPESYLRDLTTRGLQQRYGTITDELRQRADYELHVITSMGFTGYFLIVWDFIRYAKDNAIPVGPGRGSGAGSIVAYSLQITDIDPLKYGLLFERFLNPDRVSMPDFDIDFCFERRPEVIEYVNRKYGSDKVGQIITFGTLKAKAVIRDVARVLDLPYAEADQIAKLVPATAKNLAEAMEQEPKLNELRERGEVYAELIDTSLRLEGLARHASTHAAGIVIGKEKLTHYVPLYRDPKTGSISTQYTMDLLEDCGLVKMDFLGLKTLTLIKNTEALIRKSEPDFDIEKASETDSATFRMLGEGKSACVFQFESTGMQNVLKRARPTKIEELIALNALYRPGPMENIDQFVDSKWGRTAIKYPHASLEDVLKETYGVIVYQEQVMQIVRVIAGFSLGQADILRKAMGKKKRDAMEKMKSEYLQGAATHGVSQKHAEEIFTLLEPFAGYGFNKAHAAAYSVLAYKTAFLKANYPSEFMAANLTNEINSPDKFGQYITETRQMGLEVLPPDVNLSEMYFTVVNEQIIYGLMGIKNVGQAAVTEVLRARTEDGAFTSFPEFLERVDLKTVNRKVVEMFIQSGVFDSLSPNRATLMHNLDRLIDIAVQKRDGRKFGQVSLFESCQDEEFPAIELIEVPEWPDIERLRHEKENLGFYFSGHPLDNYRDRWQGCVDLNLSKSDRTSPDKVYSLIGLLKGIRTIITRKGTPMAFATLEDYNGSIELLFFGEAYEKYRDLLIEESITGMLGKVDLKRGTPQVIVEEVRKPEEMEERETGEVHIRLDDTIGDEEGMYRLRADLLEYPGGCPVFIHVNLNGSGHEAVVRVSGQLTVSSRKEVLDSLQAISGVAEAWKQ